MLVITGPGFSILSARELETTSPFLAVIDAVPDCPIRLADTVAVSCVALTKLVAIGAAFQKSVVAPVNPSPIRLSVKAGPPAVTEEGERLVRMSPWVITKGSDGGEA